MRRQDLNVGHNSFTTAIVLLVVLWLAQDAAGGAQEAAPPPTQSETSKVPLPKEAQIVQARKLIREAYKKDFDQAKGSKARVALAQTLINGAAELAGDSNRLYALLAEAAENAATGGDLLLALRAVQQVDEHFATPAFELKEKVGKLLIPVAKTPDQIIQLVEMYQSVLREALAWDDIDAAERCAQTALVLARKPGMGMLKEQMTAVAKDVGSFKSALENSEAAREKLKLEPEDAAANLVWGKYACFMKEDWSHGLPLLVKSKDARLADLARRDLDRVAEAAADIKLGDDWWSVAATEKEPARSRISLHAIEAYRRALPQLEGLDRTSVEGKILRAFGKSRIISATGDAQGTAIADASLDLGANGTIECWMQVPEGSTGSALLGKRHTIPEGSLAIAMRNGRVGLFEAATNPNLHNEQLSQESIADDRWHHLAIVKAGTNAALFYDGKRIAELTCRNEHTSKSPWKIGATQDYDPTEMRACKVRISNGARYLVSFRPDYNYQRDKATVYFSDVK